MVKHVNDILEYFDKIPSKPLKKATIKPTECTSQEPLETQILHQLSATGISIDVLSRELNKPVQELYASICKLEIAKKIERHANGMVTLLLQAPN